jgi:hypothetical protein
MQTSDQLAAELDDSSVPDLDGEIDFYRELTNEERPGRKWLRDDLVCKE